MTLQLNGNFNGLYTFGKKHDMDNWSSALTTYYRGSLTSWQNVMNFGLQTPSTWPPSFLPTLC